MNPSHLHWEWISRRATKPFARIYYTPGMIAPLGPHSRYGKKKVEFLSYLVYVKCNAAGLAHHIYYIQLNCCSCSRDEKGIWYLVPAVFPLVYQAFFFRRGAWRKKKERERCSKASLPYCMTPAPRVATQRPRDCSLLLQPCIMHAVSVTADSLIWEWMWEHQQYIGQRRTLFLPVFSCHERDELNDEDERCFCNFILRIDIAVCMAHLSEHF